MSAPDAPIAGLALLSGWGFYSLIVFGGSSGAFDRFEQAVASGVLPGTNLHYSPTFTGHGIVDHFISYLVSLYYPCVDGSAPPTSLLAVYVAGQMAALWLISSIEAAREGNAWRVPYFFAFAGIMGQVVGAGTVLPSFLALCLVTSGVSPEGQGIIVAPSDLKTVPISIGLGVVLPVVLMGLVGSDCFSTAAAKANVIRLWQFFPLYPPLIRLGLKPLTVLFSKSGVQPVRQQRSLLAINYKSALLCAAATHAFFWTISLSASFAPVLFNPDHVEQLAPQSIWDLPLPWSKTKTSSLADGSHWFLEWNFATVSAAYLTWALTLHLTPKQSEITFFTFVGQLVKTVLYTAMAGPAGAVVMLVWQRDDAVLSRFDESVSHLKVE